MDDEFTDALLRAGEDAYMAERFEEAAMHQAFLAVARVALERAAEAARVRAADLYAEADEMARNPARDRRDEIDFGRMAREIRTRGNVAMVLSEDIRALIPNEVEGLLPVEGTT